MRGCRTVVVATPIGGVLDSRARTIAMNGLAVPYPKRKTSHVTPSRQALHRVRHASCALRVFFSRPEATTTWSARRDQSCLLYSSSSSSPLLLLVVVPSSSFSTSIARRPPTITRCTRPNWIGLGPLDAKKSRPNAYGRDAAGRAGIGQSDAQASCEGGGGLCVRACLCCLPSV